MFNGWGGVAGGSWALLLLPLQPLVAHIQLGKLYNADARAADTPLVERGAAAPDSFAALYKPWGVNLAMCTASINLNGSGPKAKPVAMGLSLNGKKYNTSKVPYIII